jgi:hypothetical protein
MAREPIPEDRAPASGDGDDFVSKIVEDPKSPPQTLLLSGYIGAASVPEHTRLYLDPELSDYVDIPNEAILHVAHRPPEQGPLRGSYIWIKRDAELLHAPATTARRRGTFLEGRMQQAFAAAAAPGPFPLTVPPAVCNPTQVGVACQHTLFPAACPQTIAPPCPTHVGLACQHTAIFQVCHPTVLSPPCAILTATPGCHTQGPDQTQRPFHPRVPSRQHTRPIVSL